MHTTSPWRAVSRVALVLGLFFTGCCFLDSWHAPFFFNFRYQWLKLILSFVIPAAVTVWNFLAERSLRFAGTACAVLMQVSLVLFFIDRYTVNLIARLDDSRIIYHFLYTLISVFTLLAAGWICARCSKACVDFALFYRRFSLGYLPLCAFLFILQFFLLRTFGNIFVTANSVPFRGEIYCLWYYAKTGTLSFSTALHSAGNVLYFTSLSLALCGTVRRRPMLWGTLVPVALSYVILNFFHFQSGIFNAALTAKGDPYMLGIIGAMDVEVRTIKDKMTGTVTTRAAGCDFVTGELKGVMITVVQCAPGKVNAALCTQLLIDRFQVDRVINIGVACSLSERVVIKNIVIATDVCQYDIDITALGEPKGFINGLGTIKVATDPTLSDRLARTAINSGERIHRGTVASGDTFIGTAALKSAIAGEFDALCGEMEGGAVGQVCAANGVPFAVMRAISDGGDENAAMDYPTFKKIAAELSATILTRFVAEEQTQESLF